MFKETIQRLKEKSPKYFVKLKKYALIVGGSAGSIMLVNESFGLILDDIVIKILSYIIAICAGIASTSQLTKQ